MFVSYSIKNNGYGYMCFKEGTSIFYVQDFLNDVMIDKTSIIFACNYSQKRVTFIETYRDGTYRTEKYNKFIRNVTEVNDVYLYLYKLYGFTNILGYH